MSKKAINICLIILGIFLIFLGVLSFFTESLIFGFGKGRDATTLQNPTVGLNDEEAIEQFDETFVRYLLYSIGAHKLHNPPFSSDTPKVEIYVGELVFNAEIDSGKILVNGKLESKDMIIRTTKIEAIKMIRDRDYIEESFKEGRSTIEPVASKARLFAKGYAKVYITVTGRTVKE